jgi:hypothetical protein
MSDTRIRPAAPARAPVRRLTPLAGPEEALRLLGSTWLGRIVFVADALPAIRPVDHIVADGAVVVRTGPETVLAATLRRYGSEGVVVTYEADDVDLAAGTGWSVIVTGRATLVTDPDRLRRYRALLHSPVESPLDLAVRIRPVIVTGYRLQLTAPPAAEA